MTYQSEPTRWTESPGDAPELLRSAIRACADEGPSDSQMRSLALKLAVVGGGAAVIASAASAAASASAASGVASAGVASAGTLAASGGSALTFAKVAAVSVALIGAAATGAVMVRRDAAPSEAARHRAPAIAAPLTQQATHDAPQPVVEPRVVPAAAVERTAKSEREVPVAPAPAPIAPAAKQPALPIVHEDAHAADDARAAKRAERREARHQARIATREATPSKASETPVSQVELPRELPRSARGASAGELELLHHARAALSVRPLSAYALTEQHRSTYPDGVFTQERDALAVEALLRAGDMDRARSLAERFIKKYPSSVHAHRFRETMKLQ